MELIRAVKEIPHNILLLDTAVYERALHSSGFRGIMLDPKTNKSRQSGSTLSLENLLRSFVTHPFSPEGQGDGAGAGAGMDGTGGTPAIIPNVMMHNAGNDALMCLFALQMMLEPALTKAPTVVVKPRHMIRPTYVPNPAAMGMGMGASNSLPVMPVSISMAMAMPPPVMSSGYLAMVPTPLASPSYDLAGEFGQMQLEATRSRSPALPRVFGSINGNGNGSMRGSWKNSRRRG